MTPLILLLSAVALAEGPARPVEVVALKSGAYIQLDRPTAERPGRLTFVQPADEARVVALECRLTDAAAWRSWAGFMAQVAAESLPAAYTAAAFSQDGGCSADAAYGAAPRTEKVVTLTVKARMPDGEAGVSVATSISRRESEDLAARLQALATVAAEVESERAAAEAEAEAEAAEAEAGVCEEGGLVALRTLYSLQGWSRAGDPGWEVDVAAMQAAMDAGWLPSDVVVRAMQERRLRPGTLGDVLGLALD
jgi:hypothetical protein